MQDEFDLIASEEQIRKMNEEYDKLDRERKSSQSHLFSYPIPVYMTDKCAEFCKRCTAIAKNNFVYGRSFLYSQQLRNNGFYTSKRE